MADLKLMIPAETIDALGMSCPHPVILTRKAIEKLPVGAILKVICDAHACAEGTIPRYCEKNGFELQSVWLEDKSCWNLYIRKL